MKSFAPLTELFSQHLNNYKAELTDKIPSNLYLPEDYILSLGGKRIRPLLVLIACDLFDKPASLALNSALSVELFHNFSLIHDDILDKAPLRRNQATVHKKWNNNVAILSGDVMLVKCFKVLENYGFKEYKKLVPLLSETAIEVCEGQQMDMDFEKSKNISVEDYIKMITLKTAVLLGCSLKMGAINANTSETDQYNLYAFGKHLGIAFQLMDDYLDAFSKPNGEFGKQIGGDIIANKKTYLLLKANALADSVQKKQLNHLIKLKENQQKIDSVISLYRELGVDQLCKKQADFYTEKAISHLTDVHCNPTKKQQLIELAYTLLGRVN